MAIEAIENNNRNELTKPSALVSVCEYIKLFIASGVVTTLVLVACVGISNQYCILQIQPAGLFILLILALVFLMYLESLHFACKYKPSFYCLDVLLLNTFNYMQVSVSKNRT